MHDFGGPWGLKWANDHPNQVGSITLINCGILEGYKWHGFAKIWQTPILGELAQLTTTAWGMHRALNRMSPEAASAEFHRPGDEVRRLGAQTPRAEAVPRSKRVGKAPPELGEFAKTLPVCVIWGAGDPFIRVEFAEKQKQYFPQAKYTYFKGWGTGRLSTTSKPCGNRCWSFLRRHVGS